MSIVSALGNGNGFVYVTGPSGTFPPPPSLGMPAVAYSNSQATANHVRAAALTARVNTPDNAASFSIEITVAAAVNLTVFTIGGVAQIAARVAMTIGDPTASALAWVNAVNALVTVPNWIAVANGGTINMQCVDTGVVNNDLAIGITFSAPGMTISNPSVTSGGTDPDTNRKRFFLNTDNAADPTLLGAAIEITDVLASLPPNIPFDVAVAANALTFDRKDTINNIAATGGGTINNIFMADAQYGDRVGLSWKRGEPPSTIATGAGNIYLSTGTSFALNSSTQTLELVFLRVEFAPDPPEDAWVEVASRIEATPTNLRASGSQVPLLVGSTAIATLLGGGVKNFTPGSVDKQNAYLTGPGVLGGGGFSVALVAGGVADGDSGTIYGNGIALTGDPLTVAGFIVPAALKATGRWSIDWRYVSGSFIIMPSWDLVNTPDWITNSMIGPAAVGNTEIATGIDGAKLIANSVGYGQVSAGIQAMLVGGGILYASVSITSTDVLALGATPQEIIPAPGLGLAIVVQQWACDMTFATTAYATNTDLAIRNPTAVFEQGRNSFFLTSAPAAGTYVFMHSGLQVNLTDTQIVPNQSLEAVVLSGNPTAGDSNITIRVWYRIVAI